MVVERLTHTLHDYPFGPPSTKPENKRYISAGVNEGQVVYLDRRNTVAAANALNETHAGRVVGIALETRSEGKSIEVAISGSVTHVKWKLTPGAKCFVSSGGMISHDPPDVGFVQRIGVAENEQTILLQIGEPVVLGG